MTMAESSQPSLSPASIPQAPLLGLFRKVDKLPMGKKIFAKALCFKAPYFSSIKPELVALESGKSHWQIKKRRAVTNHLGTVHALAMGNLCELAAGTLLEATLPPSKRWIPKGMQIDYLKKAETDLDGIAQIDPLTVARAQGDTTIEVIVTDKNNTPVVKASINMWISDKK